ncbi:hypothetical protein H1S01_15710 [Heliobacterium chlorum]|uniref:Uncharacterized protein n=1 Tax=Heliobacterium chlorum TaxID=2698 RepID=A0ABR7T751_HELCL|nr:hypothetical protein [Heliobacterium chlorum]MBC9785932.1 hypothetical protein [Heliobacterium chlorum]
MKPGILIWNKLKALTILEKVLLLITLMFFTWQLYFNIYKLTIYFEYKKHLEVEYPDKTFRINWVTYDPIKGDYSSKAYCNEDGTEFRVGGNYDSYLQNKDAKEMRDLIDSCFIDKEILQYIAGVIGNKELQEDDHPPKYNFNVYFHYNVIKDDETLANKSIEIINILKRNNLEINSISFSSEREEKLIELLMEHGDINKNANEIQQLIRVKKADI